MNTYKNPSVRLPGENEIRKNVPQSKKGKEYREIKDAYFVFIDMLGFKANFNNDDMKKEIKIVFEYFNSLMEQMQWLNDGNENCYAGQTSDSLYFYTNDITYLFYFIRVFLHFNAYAMSKNVFFRGGISKGTLYVNRPYQYYGDCVIYSYLLESDVSSFPRFSIDEKTMQDIEKYLDREHFDDSSERNFLNPFSPSIMEDISVYLKTKDPMVETINIKLIKSIYRRIKTNIKKNEFNDKNYKKYIYLLESCERFLESLKE